jgi:hypothetical protein
MTMETNHRSLPEGSKLRGSLPSRRRFLFGAAATLLAAPAIVRASSLMAIKPLDQLALAGWEVVPIKWTAEFVVAFNEGQMTMTHVGNSLTWRAS